MGRKSRYRLKHKQLGLCINCPNKPWGYRVTCKKCTLKRRIREQRPGPRATRLARFKLRDRRKNKSIPKVTTIEGNEKWKALGS